MTLGAGWFSPPKAFARKRSAAAASRLADRRKSIVAPVESTARYKYTHLPLNRIRSHPLANCRWSVGAAVAIGAELLGRNAAPISDGDVVDRKSALGKEFLDVTVRRSYNLVVRLPAWPAMR